MAQQDDCYFFYYSTCSKGDACPYRHCEAALGSETVCTLWKEGRCHRAVCKFRHMDIVKDRSTIPCYWESQPGGCTKPHCVFKHQGDKTYPSTAVQPRHPQRQVVEQTAAAALNADRSVTQPAFGHGKGDAVNLDLSTASNPATPKVEQVVINPCDEESDQESCVGTPVKTPGIGHLLGQGQPPVWPQRRKAMTFPSHEEQEQEQEGEDEEPLNFGIKSLEEIRKEKLQQAKRLVEEADSFVANTLPILERNLLSSNAAIKEVEVQGELNRRPMLGMDSSRRVVIAEDVSAPPPAPAPRLSVVSRLGLKVTRPESKGPSNVRMRLGRLPPTEPTPAPIEQKEEGWVTVKTLAEIRREKQHRTQDGGPASQLGVRIKSLAEIRQERALQQKACHGQPNGKPVKDTEMTRSSMDVRVKSQIVVLPTSRGLPNRAGGDTRGKDESSPKKPRIQLYKPPAMKEKEVLPVQKPKTVATRKNPAWGSKTYSEILREKQLKKQQSDGQTGDAGDRRQPDRQTGEDTADRTVPSKKRCFSPVTFDAAERDAKAKKHHKFQPVVFDLDKNSAAVAPSENQTAESVEPKGKSVADVGAKRKRSISPIKFDHLLSSKPAPGGSTVTMDLTPGGGTVTVDLTPGGGTVTVDLTGNDVQKAVVTSSSDSPSEESEMHTVAVTSVKAVTLRRNLSSDTAPVAAAPRRKSSSDTSRRQSLASNKSLHDADDQIDAELDDFLDDFDMELPNSTSKTTVTSAVDEDDLLQEMEELLA